MCLGIKPRAVGWKVQTNPQRCGGSLPMRKLKSKFISRYGNPKKGIAAQSNRVLANGGLSALRQVRLEPISLDLASAGQSTMNPTSAFLSALPPKVHET